MKDNFDINNIEELLQSFKKHLLENDKSAGTCETYCINVRLLQNIFRKPLPKNSTHGKLVLWI